MDWEFVLAGLFTGLLVGMTGMGVARDSWIRFVRGRNEPTPFPLD